MQEHTTVFDEREALNDQAHQPPAPTNVEMVAELGEMGSLRGVTDAAADLAPCTCPGPCERDHANE